MGCDIHVFIERRWRDRWICITEHPDNAEGRNYDRFAALAGVRGDGPDPLGLPKDCSDSIRYRAENYDGHSHSWLTMKDACEVWSKTGSEYDGPDDIMGHFFGIYDAKRQDNYRVVFWFDS